MKLFGSKVDKNAAPVYACNGKNDNNTVDEGSMNAGRLQSVKVLGSGCKNCKALLENTDSALKTMKAGIEAEYVTDMEKVAAYGVMSTPALVVNERVVSMGKVMNASEVERLLHKIGY